MSFNINFTIILPTTTRSLKFHLFSRDFEVNFIGIFIVTTRSTSYILSILLESMFPICWSRPQIMKLILFLDIDYLLFALEIPQSYVQILLNALFSIIVISVVARFVKNTCVYSGTNNSFPVVFTAAPTNRRTWDIKVAASDPIQIVAIGIPVKTIIIFNYRQPTISV